MDELNPVLGPLVEPPAEVWAVALSGALEDARALAEFADLVPDDDGTPANPVDIPAGAFDDLPETVEPEVPAVSGPAETEVFDSSLDAGPADALPDDPGWAG